MKAKWISAGLGLGWVLASGAGIARAGLVDWLGLVKGRDHEQVAPPPAVPGLQSYSMVAFGVVSNPDDFFLVTAQPAGRDISVLFPNSEEPSEY